MSSSFSTEQEINEKLYRFEKIHQSLPAMEKINETHLHFYRQEGFLAVENVIEQTEINEAIASIMDIVFNDETPVRVQFTKPRSELKTSTERELAVRKLSEFVDFEDSLKNIALNPAVLSLVERLLGEKPKLIQDMALLKPPSGGGEKPWHQDMAYGPLAYNKPVVGVWIALDNAGIDNGCMHVIPKSQMEGGTPHYAIRDWQICDANVPVQRDVVVPLKPGGALFFHGLLMHGTPINFSEKRRRALQFHYVGESAEKINPREYKRIFTNEMTGAEC